MKTLFYLVVFVTTYAVAIATAKPVKEINPPPPSFGAVPDEGVWSYDLDAAAEALVPTPAAPEELPPPPNYRDRWERERQLYARFLGKPVHLWSSEDYEASRAYWSQSGSDAERRAGILTKQTSAQLDHEWIVLLEDRLALLEQGVITPLTCPEVGEAPYAPPVPELAPEYDVEAQIDDLREELEEWRRAHRKQLNAMYLRIRLQEMRPWPRNQKEE